MDQPNVFASFSNSNEIGLRHIVESQKCTRYIKK